MRVTFTRSPILCGVVGAAIVVVALCAMTGERLTPALLIATVVVVIAANLWDYLDWRHHTERDEADDVRRRRAEHAAELERRRAQRKPSRPWWQRVIDP